MADDTHWDAEWRRYPNTMYDGCLRANRFLGSVAPRERISSPAYSWQAFDQSRLQLYPCATQSRLNPCLSLSHGHLTHRYLSHPGVSHSTTSRSTTLSDNSHVVYLNPESSHIIHCLHLDSESPTQLSSLFSIISCVHFLFTTPGTQLALIRSPSSHGS